MIFPSSILSIFSKHDGTMSPQDGVISVDPQITPVLVLPEKTVLTPSNVAGTGVEGTSFVRTRYLSVANAIAKDERVAIIGPGLWDLLFLINYISNNTNINEAGEVYLKDMVTANISSIWYHESIANAPAHFYGTVKMAHDRESGIDVRIALAANGAGDAHSITCNLFANRLG